MAIVLTGCLGVNEVTLRMLVSSIQVLCSTEFASNENQPKHKHKGVQQMQIEVKEPVHVFIRITIVNFQVEVLAIDREVNVCPRPKEILKRTPEDK